MIESVSFEKMKLSQKVIEITEHKNATIENLERKIT